MRSSYLSFDAAFALGCVPTLCYLCLCSSPYQGGQVYGAPQGAMYGAPGGAPTAAPWAGQYPYQQAAAAAAAQGQPQTDPNHQAAWAAYYQQLYAAQAAQAQAAQAQQGAQRQFNYHSGTYTDCMIRFDM